jgi:hypothetical protein
MSLSTLWIIQSCLFYTYIVSMVKPAQQIGHAKFKSLSFISSKTEQSMNTGMYICITWPNCQAGFTPDIRHSILHVCILPKSLLSPSHQSPE